MGCRLHINHPSTWSVPPPSAHSALLPHFVLCFLCAKQNVAASADICTYYYSLSPFILSTLSSCLIFNFKAFCFPFVAQKRYNPRNPRKFSKSKSCVFTKRDREPTPV